MFHDSLVRQARLSRQPSCYRVNLCHLIGLLIASPSNVLICGLLKGEGTAGIGGRREEERSTWRGSERFAVAAPARTQAVFGRIEPRGGGLPKGSSEVKRSPLLSGGGRIDFTLGAASSRAPPPSKLFTDPGPGEKLHYRLSAIPHEQPLFPLNAGIHLRPKASILRKEGRSCGGGVGGGQRSAMRSAAFVDLKRQIKSTCY